MEGLIPSATRKALALKWSAITFKEGSFKSLVPQILAASLIKGANKSVSKLLCFPCNTAAILSKPIPVSTHGFGSGLKVPSFERSNCAKTKFHISINLSPGSAPMAGGDPST